VRLLLLVAFLTLAIAEGSVASTFPGERPAPPAVQQAAQVGLRFWSDRGVHPCQNPRLLTAPDLGDSIAGYADEPSCTLWILRGVVERLSWRAYMCAVVTHELGHLAGLGHSAHGVMSTTENAVPWECRVWARGLAPPRAVPSRHGR
jgi:hypothetical protein